MSDLDPGLEKYASGRKNLKKEKKATLVTLDDMKIEDHLGGIRSQADALHTCLEWCCAPVESSR